MTLFASVYLDEDVNPLIATLLIAHGFSAQAARDLDTLAATDDAQIATAVRLQACFLTHNRVDFEKIHAQFVETGRTHYGTVIAQGRRPHEVTDRLMRVLNNFTADEIMGLLLYV